MYLDKNQIREIGESQTEELEKIALNVSGIGESIGKAVKSRSGIGKDLMSSISDSGANKGRIGGALVGAGGGAATGATVDEEDRGRGALLGALGGAALGVGAGQFATSAGRKQAKNFGLRQAHGLTGYTKGHGFTGIHKMTPDQRIKALKEMEWDVPEAHSKDTTKAVRDLKEKRRLATEEAGGLKKRIADSKVGKWWEDSKPKDLLLKKKIIEERAQRDIAEQGMTSVPGAIRSYALGSKSVPGGDGLTRAQQLKSNLVAPGLTMGVGLPAASIIGSGIQSAETGDTKSFGSNLLSEAGYASFAGLPLLPAIAIGEGVHRGAQYLLGSGKPGASSGTPVRTGQSAKQLRPRIDPSKLHR